MLLDCAIIGGGPAGLNASLVLARAKMKIRLFDEDLPRNAVTHESHGFITRDGIKPAEFKRIAKEELLQYPDITIGNQRVTAVIKDHDTFIIHTSEQQSYRSKKVILATGLKDVLPNIEGIYNFYGKSLFICPFCDGWELRDRKLVLITENEHAMHGVKLIYNWSKNLVVCTNGKDIFTKEQKELLSRKNIMLLEDEIVGFHGEDGYLQKVLLRNGKEIEREGGFIGSELKQASTLAEILGCRINERGGIEIDALGRTSIKGVYACGDITLGPSQLIHAASEGSKAASGVVMDLANESFLDGQ